MPDNNDDSDIPQSSGMLDGMDVGEEKNDLDKIFEKMLDAKNIYHFTELNQDEITGFSTLGVLTEKYMPQGVAHKWLIINLQMRVSKGRKGKNEFVKITARGNGYQDQPQNQRNPFSLFRN